MDRSSTSYRLSPAKTMHSGSQLLACSDKKIHILHKDVEVTIGKRMSCISKQTPTIVGSASDRTIDDKRAHLREDYQAGSATM
ncbi:hypothetical protein [Aminobacter sp. AP02]|uniref:hypothetical protein n=1 Tax=Aminobacter sp. AP02 TaxID=2135737 RepID=UPI000D7AD534|nr:hypothetical protein [Aminobacter sp. AP02]PWK67542.1 hypothetical protein C8K44_11294 [Aminobacter sp. AP02]